MSGARPASDHRGHDRGWLGLGDVHAAHRRIAPHVARTPVVRAWDGVALKAESLHGCGSFKTRGAFNTLLQLPDGGAAGVVAHSSGNHAIAVAEAGRRLGIRTVIVMPHDAPAAKRERTAALGAEVHLVGSASDERVRVAAELAVRDGLVPVEPYDSTMVIAATGTIALELAEPDQAPDVTEIFVGVSGGGLASGVALAAVESARRAGRTVRVIGVEPEVAADALASRRAGERVRLPAEQMARTMADGLRVQQVGATTWPYLQRYLHDVVTVGEDELRDAMRVAARECRLVVEPSGAVPLAAARAGRGSAAPPEHRAVVVGGGNVDTDLLAAVLADDRPAAR